MQTLPPSSKLTFNSITPTPTRHAFTIPSAARRYDSAPNATNPAASTAVRVNTRTDFQSYFAILASKVALHQENACGADNITVVDNHKTLNLPTVGKIPKPLTLSDRVPDRTLRVAYQGLSGAYSEIAAGKAYPECDAISCDNSELAFQAVELWIADRAVLPVENSLGGSIHRNYDLLLRHRLHIIGEIQLSFHHCLLALPGVCTEHINRVISHPQALAHCEQTLTKLGLNNITREAVADTAGAAEFVAKNNLRDTAAIASARAAEIYNLNILTDAIEDESHVTRFMMLAREPIVPRNDRQYKTSIVFAQDKGTSVLYKVLSAFEFRDIRLTKIETRPNRNRPIRVVDDGNIGTAKHFEYMFYVDFEASMADVRAQNAMVEVQEYTSFLRVLGSYPMDVS